ncbi:hypothetical protein FZEAL_5329 [Fusarium zealandicum]|uniref:Secreted in xylem 9 n=1 Tax=Fusarium zealandicum TaxID=1053134 RepID=A0A8H4UKK6_9HYPO|nr:hypothetical protein FZEAL_5329 [Fusarium zealandicum]
MKLLSVAATAFAIFSTANAETTQIGCFPLVDNPKNRADMVDVLKDAGLRGQADWRLSRGFWDGKWGSCCGRFECDPHFIFMYNGPYAFAYRERETTYKGNKFKFACVNWHMGNCK